MGCDDSGSDKQERGFQVDVGHDASVCRVNEFCVRCAIRIVLCAFKTTTPRDRESQVVDRGPSASGFELRERVLDWDNIV